jgi:predicted O-linked N-acetylglucosamine transferase (SPINDLY family)
VFQLNRDADEETLQARKIVAEVEDRPTKLADWAGAIKASNLDVLLYPSVGMDPLTQQLAALRLAPIQAVTWGHPETTGFPTLDIYLSAELLEPANAEGHYSERLVRLPNLGVYVEPLAPPQAALDLAALGLPDDAPLLLCPGTPFKYSPQTDDVWVAIAKGLQKRLFGKSRGRLVFFRSQMANLDRVLETRLRAAFARADLDFERRVSIVPNLDRGRYFALMRHAACLLDTLEFSGFNTALQALQCDLPVLAYEGEFMRGRLASALLRKLDLPALVATTKQEFIAKAIDLARDATKRRSLRDAVSRRRETLFRDEAPVRALEELLAGEVSRFRAASG